MTRMQIHFTLVAALALAVVAGCSSTTDNGGDLADAKAQPDTVKAGFAVFQDGKHTWVFREGSDELKKHMRGEELAKHVTKMKSVNGRIVMIKAPDTETIDAYMASSASQGSTSSKVGATANDEVAAANAALDEVVLGRREATTGTHVQTAATRSDVVASANRVAVPPASPKAQPTARRAGYVLFEGDKATWIFREGSEELKDHMVGRELAKHVTKMSNVDGKIVTIKAPDSETIDAFLAVRPGFAARVIDGYLWVFYENSDQLKAVDAGNELAKHVTKMTNVNGKVRTLKAPDTGTIEAYLAARPGFATRVIDGYLWVFHQGSEDLAVVDAGGELAKHVTKMTNVNGKVRTLKAPDAETLKAYNASAPGFIARYVDGHMWVFREGSKAYHTIASGGELAKHVTRMKNLNGSIVTLKAADTETLDAYLAIR